MKRTASTLLLLAGLGGGGCVSPASNAQNQQPATGGFGTVTRAKEIGNVQGPLGEPVMATAVRGAAPTGVQQAGGTNTLFGNGLTIRPAGAVNPNQVTAADGATVCMVPGVGGSVVRDDGYVQPAAFGGGGLGGVGAGLPPVATGPAAPANDYSAPYSYRPNMPKMPRQGVLPVPAQSAPGAVAAGVGALVPGMSGPGMGRTAMSNGRSSINFTGPAGMKITWQLPDGTFNDETNALTAPKEYNFLQAQVYRLRLTSILPDHPGRAFYPTLEVYPASQKTLTFLAHSSVPITFSSDDFAQAKAGNLVVKVVYLPDPANQDFSTDIGAVEVVSTRLEPGADPVAEAQRRGTVLAVIRMGNIDLENRISPAMTAPPPGAVPYAMPPGMGLPGPRPLPGPAAPTPAPPRNGALDPLGPLDPVAPKNPPGTATLKSPAVLPALPPAVPTAPEASAPPVAVAPEPAAPILPPAAPTDLPPAPVLPVAPPAPGPNAK